MYWNSQVAEKNANGWWLVNMEDQQGWVPATFLEPVSKDARPNDEQPVKTPYGKSFVSIAPHKASQLDEVSFERGVVVQVAFGVSFIDLVSTSITLQVVCCLPSFSVGSRSQSGWLVARQVSRPRGLGACCMFGGSQRARS
jgi:hypothetical protein